MEAKICDRCGAIWKDAKEEVECGVYVYKITVLYEQSDTVSLDLCVNCVRGLTAYLENKKDGK